MKNVVKLYENMTDLVEEDPYNNNQQCGIFLYIDWENETVDVETHYRDGTTPFAVYHNRATQIKLPHNIDAQEIRSNINELLPILNKISDGFDTEWNGHNWIGKFTEKSEEKLNNLIYEIEEYPSKYFNTNDNIGLWGANDWFVDKIDEITASATNNEIVELAKSYYDEAFNDGVVIQGGIGELIRLFTEQRNDLGELK
jgi:hypothetical protein